jgi:hypothetical protein
MKTLLNILHDIVLLIACGAIGVVVGIGLLICLFLVGAALEDLAQTFRRRKP